MFYMNAFVSRYKSTARRSEMFKHKHKMQLWAVTPCTVTAVAVSIAYGGDTLNAPLLPEDDHAEDFFRV